MGEFCAYKLMRKPLHIGIVVMAGSVLIISLIAFRRYLPYAGNLISTQQPAIVLQMRNAHFVGLNDGKKIWSLDAKRVEIGQNRHITTLTHITNGKIYELEEMALQVEAGRAMYNSVAGNLHLEEGISLTGSDGQSLTAPGANWNSNNSTLNSAGKVLYRSPWGNASTDSISVDLKNKEMTMQNVVISIIPDKLEAAENAR